MDVSGLPYPARLNAAAELLDRWIATGHGKQPALYHADATWTYQQLHDAANRIANVLVDDCGLVPGGRVLLRAANQPLLVAAWFAVLKAGGIAVTTMPLLREKEIEDVVAQAQITLAIADARVSADLESAMQKRGGGQVLRFNATDANSLEARMASKPPTFASVQTFADDPAIVAFTSGTTGRAKGAVHFHRDLLAAGDTYGRHVLAPRWDDVFVASPSIAFTYALGGVVLFPMRVGAASALIEQASPALLAEAIEKFRATIVFTSPTGYRAMLKQAGEFDWKSLRACVSAGETLPAATFDAWLKATGIALMDGIGSTEMLHIFVGSPAAEAKSGSTGRAVPGYRAKVVDEHGNEVPHGTIGRLAVTGPTGCRYLANPEQQRNYVQRGWNLTGDAYRQDEDGYFWFEARTDDLIISSGYNVSGIEVENVLIAHAAVAECAVVGVPDDARGHLVKAVVVLAADAVASDGLARELQDFVKARLAPYKYPRVIEFVKELPKTLTGKIQRFRLRAAEADRAHGDGASTEGLQFHDPETWPRPIGYANAVSASGRMVFVAGQIGWDPVTQVFPAGGFVAEVRQAFLNVAAALDAAGARPDQIVRLTWYVTDREAYNNARKEIGHAYRQVFGRHFPAMAVVIVAGLVEPAAHIEIEATAVV